MDGNVRGANGLGVGTSHTGPLMRGHGSFAGSSTGCERAASNPPPPRDAVAEPEVSASEASFGPRKEPRIPPLGLNGIAESDHAEGLRSKGMAESGGNGAVFSAELGIQFSQGCGRRYQPGGNKHSHCDVSLTRVGIAATWPQRQARPMKGAGWAWSAKSDGGAGIKKPARRGPAGALRPIAFRRLYDPMNKVKNYFWAAWRRERAGLLGRQAAP